MDQSYQLLACRYLRSQLDALMDAIECVRRGGDIECLHKSRVATRRIRAALGMFTDCFTARRVKLWRKHIRRVTRGLGSARDTDVQIEFVESFLSRLDGSHETCRPGIVRLALRLRQRRESVQPAVVRALDKFESTQIPMQMHCQLERLLFGLRRTGATLQSPFVFQRTREHILLKYDALRACKASLDDPEDKQSHHQMRIATKRLRYTMEICSGAYEEQLSKPIKAVRKLQTLLGDIHDCDVWMDFIADFAIAERQRTFDYYGHAEPFDQLIPGLDYLAEERQSVRHRTFEELIDYWMKLEADGLWQQLISTIEARIQQSNEGASDSSGV
jgi:CHAD domain-containing protein